MSILVDDNAPSSRIDETTMCPACVNRYDAQQHTPVLVSDAGLSFTACRACVQRAIETVRAASSSPSSPPPTEAPLHLRNRHTARISIASLDEPLVVDVAAIAQANALIVSQNKCCVDACSAHATKRCNDCQNSFCAEHVTWHTEIPALRTHALVDIDARAAYDASAAIALASTLATCPQHAHLDVSKYLHWCNECARPLCVHCTADHTCEHVNNFVNLAQAVDDSRGQQIVADTLERIESVAQGCSRAIESAGTRSRFFDAHCEHVVGRLTDFKACVVELVNAEIRRTREFSHECKQSVDTHKLRVESSFASLSAQLRAMQAARDAADQATPGDSQAMAPLVLATRVRQVLQRVEREVDQWHRAEDYRSVQFGLDKTVTESIVQEMDLGASRVALEATALMSELKRQLGVEVRATEEDEKVFAAIVAAVGVVTAEEQERRKDERRERERQEREHQEPERQERERQERERRKREAAEQELSTNVAIIRRLVQQQQATTELTTTVEAVELATRSVMVCQEHVWVSMDHILWTNDGVALLRTMDSVLKLPNVSNNVIVAVSKIVVNAMLARTMFVGGPGIVLSFPPLVSSLQAMADRCHQGERVWVYRALLALPGHGVDLQTTEACRAAIQQAGGSVPVLFMNDSQADCGGVVRNVELFAQAGLRSLTLRALSVGRNVEFEVFDRCLRKVPQLTSFDMSYDSIGAYGCRALASSLLHVPQLTSLNVSWSDIGDDGCHALASSLQHVPQLTLLNVSSNKFGDESCTALASSLQHIPKLTSLDVSHSVIGDRGCRALASSLQRVPRLTSLEASSNYIGADGCLALALSLEHVPHLRSLGLNQNKIGAVGCVSLALFLQHVSQLTSLNVSHNEIGAEGCRMLALSLQRIRHLAYFDLKGSATGGRGLIPQLLAFVVEPGNFIGDELCRALASSLHHIPQLMSLNVSSNSIRADAFRALTTSLKHVPQLTSLDVSLNSIRAEGCRALASSLQHVPQLTSLDLSSTAIGVEGCRALASSLQLVPQLTKLKLEGNSIDDDGCRALASSLQQLPQLTSLDVWNNPIGDAGKAALAPYQNRLSRFGFGLDVLVAQSSLS